MNTENQLRQIADRIRYLREILEVSDEELASKINMPIRPLPFIRIMRKRYSDLHDL